MMKCLLGFLLVSLATFANSIELASSNVNFKRDDSKSYTEIIQFQNSRPTKKNENRCTFIKVKNNRERQYITEIQPVADKRIAHHMTLFACSTSPKRLIKEENTNSWDCGSTSVCGPASDFRRLYTWALNAKGIRFPDGVGIRVGGDSDLDFLVIQVHYNKIPNEDEPSDSSSLYNLTMTSQELPYQVGVYNIGNNGFIPPKQESFKFESACLFEAPYEIVPIFYRTHAHNIINVMSIYTIKNESWIELGRMSPHQPQAFYPVTSKDIVVGHNDLIAARCTINSMDRDEITYTGNRHEDEMCAFYLMFYTDYKNDLSDYYCYKDGNRFKWSKQLKQVVETNPPENASSLDGVVLPEPENEHMKSMHHHHN